MTRQGILLGYGNPLLDISVNATEDFLKKYGLQPDNAILASEEHKPMYQDMVSTFHDHVAYVPGGATLNSLRVAEWILGKPNVTIFFGCIGKDEFGETLKAKAEEAGVNAQFQLTDKEPTGTCAVICTGKNRSLVANLAAANCFHEEHLDVPANWLLVESADFFYCASFPLTVSPSSMLRIAQHALEKKKTFCLNLSAPFLCKFFQEPMLKLLPYVDILFGNESEAEAFSQANNLGMTDIKEVASKIANWEKLNKGCPRIVVITHGDQPAVVASGNKVEEYPAIQLDPIDIVDTNGAGDAFTGGFLSQLIQGKPISECMRCAHYAASVVIQRSGCTLPDFSDFQ